VKPFYWQLIFFGFLLLNGCTRKTTIAQQIAELSVQINRDSTNIKLYFDRVELYSKLSLSDTIVANKVIHDLDKILLIDPKNREAYFGKGMIAMSKHKEDAISNFTETIKIDSGYVNPIVMRALCYMHLGNFRNSADDLTKAIAIKPTEANNYALRSSAFEVLGNYEKAIGDIQKCIKLGDTITTGVRFHYMEIGKLFAAMENDKEALHYFDKSIQGNPYKNYTDICLRGAILMHMKNFDHAKLDLESSVKLLDQDTSYFARHNPFAAPHYYLSLLYMNYGYEKKALEQFDLALEKGFSDIDLLDNSLMNDHLIIAEFKRKANQFKLSKTMWENRKALKTVFERGKAISIDELFLVEHRMREINIEPSKRQEYQRLYGIDIRGYEHSD
jgi:tetratricopeptide (TPR) repeat protein